MNIALKKKVRIASGPLSGNAYEVIRKKKRDHFLLAFVKVKKTGELAIFLSSESNKHFALHSHVEILDQNGSFLRRSRIDDKIAAIVFEKFDRCGDTESFRLSEVELHENLAAVNSPRLVQPKSIKHRLTSKEQSFTSNGDKLSYHGPIFDKYRQTGFGSIIRATMTNHQVCASRCQFCSTIARNKKDSVSLEEAIAFVDSLYVEQAEFNRNSFPEFNKKYYQSTGSDIRLKGLILSGGGQPNLWPHFSDLVAYLSNLDIDLGLITNGFPKNVDPKVYEAFQWVRISVTPEDASPFYPEGRFDFQYIPENLKHNPKVTVGYSYVFGPWTDDDIIRRIDRSLTENGFDYCRTLTDCNLTRDAQLRAHNDLANRLLRLGLIQPDGTPTRKIFHQLKFHGSKEEANRLWEEGQCFLQTYNAFWDTTGHEENGYSYCYPCDSVTVLTSEDDEGVIASSERRFDYTKWGTVKNTEVSKLFTEKVKPFFDPRQHCQSCLFMRNNEQVKKIVNSGVPKFQASSVDGIKHLNFP